MTDPTAAHIIRQLKDLGYTVAVVSLHNPERVIGSAAQLTGPLVAYELKIDGQSGAEAEYRVACALATLCGLDLMDG